MSIKSSVDFCVNVKGDITGQEFLGTFTVKTKLSMREILRQDELFRSILGVSPQDAGITSKSIASAISYLSVHVIKAPDWWKEMDNGMKVEDTNVLAEVNNKAMETIDAEYKKLDEEGKVAEKALQESKAV